MYSALDLLAPLSGLDEAIDRWLARTGRRPDERNRWAYVVVREPSEGRPLEVEGVEHPGA
jgi:hypothetical protein